MIFSLKQKPEVHTGEPASSLFRVIQLLLESYAVHSVAFDPEEQATFQTALRGIAERFEKVSDHRDLLILAGEASKTIATYGILTERFIRETSAEKQRAVEVLAQSLVKVSRASDKSAQKMRQVERELAASTRLEDMRAARLKLSDCAAAMCLEADVQGAHYRELQARVGDASRVLDARDAVTGLGMQKSAELLVKEWASSGQHGHLIAFFLKSVDVVNRRFGFAAGDDVLRRFAAYLGQSLQDKDQLFRWRGPCFVVVTGRLAPLDTLQSEAFALGEHGPEQEVESEGRTMLIKLHASTAVFPISMNRVSDVFVSVDQFATAQHSMSPALISGRG